jgi:hypothetical protein
MEKKNISFSKDGMKVGVKDLKHESYEDKTQRYVFCSLVYGYCETRALIPLQCSSQGVELCILPWLQVKGLEYRSHTQLQEDIFGFARSLLYHETIDVEVQLFNFWTETNDHTNRILKLGAEISSGIRYRLSGRVSFG